MPDIHTHVVSVNPKPEVSPGDFVWGAPAIAAVIGRSPRQTFHILSGGQIKCARKVGGRWVVSRAALLREFGAVW
jgi:hypothetical protein